MFLDHLSSSYKQYKEDTRFIATWLASTAKKCGFPSDHLRKAGDPPKPPRLKGKARKLSKQDCGHGSTGKPFSKSEYVIAVDDFLVLAQYIAAQTQPPVIIHHKIRTILERAIKLRTSVNHQISHASGDHSDDAASAATKHSYFVSVLQNVLETLRPRMTSDIQLGEAKDIQPGKEEQKDHLANLFSILEVEDYMEDPNEPKTHPAPSSRSDCNHPDTTYRFEEPRDPGEVYLAFDCLLDDFNRIRNFVIDTWEAYRKVQTDIVSAAVTTNTALELAKALEAEATSLLEEHGGSQKLLQTRFLSEYLNIKHDINEFSETEMRAKYCSGGQSCISFEDIVTESLEFYELAESHFIPSLVMLMRFRETLDVKTVLIYSPGSCGIHDDRTVDRAMLTLEQKLFRDKTILLEAFTSLKILGMTEKANVGDDELVRGISQMFKTNTITLSLCLSTQLYLDVHHVLGESINRPFQDLNRICNSISSTITATQEFHKNLKISNWPERSEKRFHSLLNYISIEIKSDHVKKKIIEEAPHLADYIEEDYILSHYPIRCGLHAYNVKTQFNDLAVNFSNAWGSILVCEHLYNALQQEKLLKHDWQDMEFVLTMQDTTNLFCGSIPKSAAEYHKRFSLAIGASAANFTQNRRSNYRVTMSSKGARFLKRGAEVCHMFVGTYLRGDEHASMCTEDIERILDRGRWLATESSNGRVTIHKRQTPKAGPKEKRFLQQKKQASIPQLLRSLLFAMEAELPELSFDYLLLHRMCWTLLRKIKASTHPALTQLYGPRYIEKENRLPMLVGFILMAMSDDAYVKKHFPLQLSFRKVSRSITQQAAAQINEFCKNPREMECAGSKIALESLRQTYGWSFVEGELPADFGLHD